MSARRRRLVVAAAAGALLSGCSAGRVISGLAPTNTYRRVEGAAYGDGPRRVLDVYRPAILTRAAPVVLFFYGENWNAGSRGEYLFVGEALASRGYVAVIPDYRLYPEVGFPDFLADCAGAAAWIGANIAAHGGDARRLFLMGHAAGAYNAAMLALDRRHLDSAGVDRRAVRGFIGLSGLYDFLPLKTDVAKGIFGFPDTPPASQPIHFASAEAPPALLVTGSDDDVIDPGNTKRLAARLRDAGAAVREVSYPGVGHGRLVGSLAAPLRPMVPLRLTVPVLDDVAAFVNQRAA